MREAVVLVARELMEAEIVRHEALSDRAGCETLPHVIAGHGVPVAGISQHRPRPLSNAGVLEFCECRVDHRLELPEVR